MIVIGLLFVLLCVLCDCACLTLIAYFNGRFKKGRRRFLLSRHMLFVGDEVEGLGVVDVVFELFFYLLDVLWELSVIMKVIQFRLVDVFIRFSLF